MFREDLNIPKSLFIFNAFIIFQNGQTYALND